MLTFNDYQTSALATVVYPDKAKIIYPALGLASEAGEVAGKLSKWVRGDGPLDKEQLAKELGDVLWNVAVLAYDLGLTMEEVAHGNIQKLLDRQSRGVLKGNGDNR